MPDPNYPSSKTSNDPFQFDVNWPAKVIDSSGKAHQALIKIISTNSAVIAFNRAMPKSSGFTLEFFPMYRGKRQTLSVKASVVDNEAAAKVTLVKTAFTQLSRETAHVLNNIIHLLGAEE